MATSTINPEIFLAYDIRGKVGPDLNASTAEAVGRAFADWLPNAGAVALGYDMRPDSKELAEALMQGIEKQGRDVINIGRVATDMIYFATGHLHLAGGAMVTASHNPGEYNGIKLCREEAGGIALGTGLEEIRDKAVSGNFIDVKTAGRRRDKDVMEDWLNHVLSFVDTDTMKPYHIAVDAGNGMAGAVMPHIATRLPLKIEEMFYELDGTFPNHEANPLKLETLTQLQNKIIDEKLDFGVAFDGDGDRAVLIDENGDVVSGSVLTAMLAEYFLAKHPGATILYNAICSNVVPETIAKNGGKGVRTRVGHTIIKNEMKRYGAVFAGEHSAHYYFADNFNADSGLLAAVIAINVLSKSGKTLSELANQYRQYQNIAETNFEVTDKEATMKQVAGAFAEIAEEVDWLDGVTVRLAGGAWFNLRPSNTEPLLRLNAEAKTADQLQSLVEEVKKAAFLQ